MYIDNNFNGTAFIRVLALLIILLTGFGVVSCDDVAVSQQVNDADIIKPIITLAGSLNNQTRVYTSRISVLLKNAEGKSIEIKNGTVKVNGFTMEPPNTAIISSNKHEDYLFYADIIPDELYVFEVILSNNQIYNAWIESPEVFPTTLNLPQRNERDTNLEVKWTNTDYRYPQFLFLQYYIKDKGFSSADQEQFNIYDPYYGVYIIDKKYIKFQDVSETSVNETRIILQSQTEGTLDQNFSQGGTITCTFKIYDELEIY